jgi:hypothetical protein
MKTLSYNNIDIDIEDLCRSIETNNSVKLGNIDNLNPEYSNGYITMGNRCLTIYFFEEVDIQQLNNSFFVVASDLDNLIISVDTFIKTTLLG